MPVRVLLALTVILLAGAVRAQGSSHPLCEEGRPGDEEVVEPTRPANPPAAILPCAMVDSGRVGFPWDLGELGGAACADSPFYIVTHAGVLLCQVDIELFAAGGDTAVERAPEAAPVQSTALHAALLAAAITGPRPPAPGGLGAMPNHAVEGGVRDAHCWRPPRPS